MNSPMMSQGATPLDMIPGWSGRASGKRATGTDEFSRLFNLFPQMASQEAKALPDYLPDQAIPAGTEVLGQATLVLPENLALLLGIRSDAYLESSGGRFTFTGSEKLLAVNAEILAPYKDTDQTLYLRIVPEHFDSELQGLSPGQDHQPEMILPMRLRTVEEQGGRLIAEAELLTAAGEEMSVRLKLELAGEPDRIWNEPGLRENLLSGTEDISRGGRVKLSRLFGELGVTRIVIEQTDQASRAPAPTVATDKVLPPKFFGERNLSASLKESSQSVKGSILGETCPDKNLAEAQRASEGKGAWPGREYLSLWRTSGKVSEQGSSFFPARIGDTGTIMAAASGIESQIDLPDSELADRSSSVRFFDLDIGLDHLKQNPGQKIRIQLVPARLGKMDLSISSHRGLVTVTLMLDSVAAKNAVQKNLSQLENRLAAAGIRVDNFQISVNQSPRGESFAAHYQQYPNGNQQDSRRGRLPTPDHRRMQRFRLSDTSFDQVMVNCLA